MNLVSIKALFEHTRCGRWRKTNPPGLARCARQEADDAGAIGTPRWPPGRVALMAATAAAKRTRPVSSSPLAKAMA